MHYNLAPTPETEQEPRPGTVALLDQRLKKTLVVNADITSDTTGRVGEREKTRAQNRIERILWQMGMIECLQSEKAWNAANEGATSEQAAEQASNLSAAEAAGQLEVWTQRILGDPHQGEDPINAAYRGHAEDLFNKLIDEASRTPA